MIDKDKAAEVFSYMDDDQRQVFFYLSQVRRSD